MKYHPVYITLDDLHRRWKACLFQRRLRKQQSFCFMIQGPQRESYIRDCPNFGEWVYLHTKQSGLYRIY